MIENFKPVLIYGVACYEQDGTAYLRLEDVARGLGFTEVAASGNTCIKWTRVRKYLDDLGVDTCVDGHLPDFIPENIFYRLAMKAKNETAEKFQALVADEIIPSIRKTGGYIAGQESMSDSELMAKALQVANKTLAEREARISALTVQNAIMAPKAEYFDELVDRNTLTSFRDTAKELGIKPRAFVEWLLEKKFIFRDQKGKLMPREGKGDDLFEVKEAKNDKTQWSGVQTLVTPKGRETFRLLYL